MAISSASNGIDPALFERLGRVVYQWSFVEAVLVMFLAFLLHADQGLVLAVSTDIRGKRLSDCIRTLVPIRFKDATTQENILGLLGRIDEAGDKRSLFATIDLAGAGLDPGLGIFHADRDRRASLAYDAVEAIRPYVDSWLIVWLSTARFSKRDFHEEADGTVRLTRPLTSHLAMTAAIWRSPAQVVASWLARALAGSLGERRMLAPLPALPSAKADMAGPRPASCQDLP